MNIQEFQSLAKGDKIDNVMQGLSSRGTVVDAAPGGVRVQWSAGSQPFFYSVHTTAWMHWTKVEAEPGT